VNYLAELERELSRAGVRGRIRSRILAEFADHLACEPDAQLGPPAALARDFADELGTSRTRRGAAAAFAALSLAGLLSGAAFATSVGFGRLSGPHSSLIGTAALWMCMLASQVAFASGTLAAVRALWRRGARSLPGAEAAVIVRRAAVGLAAGLLTMAALALVVVESPHAGTPAWRTFAVIAAAVGGAALLAAAPVVIRAARLRPSGPGQPGDIFDDLGPLAPRRWHGRPWLPAVAIAALVGVAIAAAGVFASDPYDGILRGLLDAGACLAGFGLLGRYLGLRGTRREVAG
jgi:hypothetical protein